MRPGSEEVKEVVDGALKALDVPVAALFSTLGRTAARGLETQARRAAGRRSSTRSCSRNIKNGDTRMFDTLEVGPGDLAGRGQGRRHDARRRAARWPTGS